LAVEGEAVAKRAAEAGAALGERNNNRPEVDPAHLIRHKARV
jgi:hypothetical protein